MSDAVPAGHAHRVVRRTQIVALDGELEAVLAARELASDGTLYAYASAHPERRVLRGRAPVYAVPLPRTGTRVVVRHGWHGGLLAPITGDRFLPPTRAPRELRIALRLADAGVPTPEIVAYAIYRAPLGMRTTDVLSREVPDAADLAAHLAPGTGASARRAALDAAGVLLAQLASAGARHPDLNAKNILLTPDAAAECGLRALVIDVDRVVLEGDTSHVSVANLERLVRSLHKLRAARAIAASDDELTLRQCARSTAATS